MKKKISILGSTGTIGRMALEIVELYPEKFEILALSAGENISLLIKQIKKFKPLFVSVKRKEDSNSLKEFSEEFGFKLLDGIEGACEIATLKEADIVVSAISGIEGFLPTYSAVKAGKWILLANKESLVMGGALIKEEMEKSSSFIIPVDSEHNALFQLLSSRKKEDIEKFIITASGGPFFKKKLEEMEHISREDALNHPVWKMGKKITIDSATLMNKGFELIEAHWLFSIPPEKLDVFIHPQSIVHAILQLKDGSMIAFLCTPDMKIPIQHAFFYPEAPKSSISPISIEELKNLEFYPVDYKKFPCLSLAIFALKEGGSFPTVLAVANEVAVNEFLRERIEFYEIYKVIEKVLNEHKKFEINSIEDVLTIKEWAENRAYEIVKSKK